MLRKSFHNDHISSIFTTEHTSVGLQCFTQVLTKYYKTHDEGWSYYFDYKTMVWQCSTEGNEVLFQGNLLVVTQYGWGNL